LAAADGFTIMMYSLLFVSAKYKTELDDILSIFFLHPDIQFSVSRQLMEANEGEVESRALGKRIWWMHRVQCMALMAVSAWVIFDPIAAIEFGQVFVDYRTCNCFYIACFLPALASVPFIFFDQIIKGTPYHVVVIHGICVLIFIGAIQALFMSIFWAVYFQTNLKTLWSWV
jgi:hypothetical protein